MYLDMTESNPKSTIRNQIDENLKRIYDETLNEQIPDKLTRLLEQLRLKAAGGQGTVLGGPPDDDQPDDDPQEAS